MSRRARRRRDRRAAPGRALRRTYAAAPPRLHRRGGADPRAWHRRQHGGLQPRRRHPAVAPAVSGAVGARQHQATYPNGGFAAMRDEVRTLDVGAYAEGHWLTLTGSGEPVRVAGTRVSAELFSILGVHPSLGQLASPGEDVARTDRSSILATSCGRRVRARRAIVAAAPSSSTGSPARLSRSMPASFRFPSSRTQVWVPLGLDPGNTVSYWAGDYMPVVGRLRPGATIAQAHADVRLFQSGIGPRFPWRMPGDWNRDVTVVPLQEAVVGGVRLRLLILIAAVALVLVIACANVANLSLSRALPRASGRSASATAIGAGAAPHRPPAADRERPARVARRNRRPAVRDAGAHGAEAGAAAGHAAPGRRAPQLARAGASPAASRF